MSAESFLSSAIEISVALAGFAGIVAAIRNRDITHWGENEQLLLRMLLTASGVAVCFALLPAVLHEAGLPESVVWRAGSIVLIFWTIAVAVRRSQQLRNVGSAPSMPLALPASTATSFLFQILNIYLGTSWPYLLGVLGIIVNGFIFFLLLLFGDSTTKEAPS